MAITVVVMVSVSDCSALFLNTHTIGVSRLRLALRTASGAIRLALLCAHVLWIQVELVGLIELAPDHVCLALALFIYGAHRVLTRLLAKFLHSSRSS